MVAPAQKPGQSRQDYETPYEFLAAVVRRFGQLSFDLAADYRNAKAPGYYSKEQDALRLPWDCLYGNLWLNPPFGDIPPWVRKCAATPTGVKRRILLITPASIGSNWFADHVWDKARVYALRPRLRFVGTSGPYPKDLMLSVYGRTPGFELWRWDVEGEE